MESKSTQIRNALHAGNDKLALRIASKFHDRGADTALYIKAYEANYTNPAFYKQVGLCPKTLMGNAMFSLRERFGYGQNTTKVR